MNIFYFLFSPFLICFLLLFLLRKLSLKLNWFSSNGNPPFIGGFGIFVSIVLSYLVYLIFNRFDISWQLLSIFLFSALFFLIGFVDDYKNFSLKSKLILQILIIFVFLEFSKGIQIAFLPGWLNYILSFLWIIGITNAFNLLDIDDGLCGGISLFVSIFFLMIAVIINNLASVGLFCCFAGAMLAFVLFNFPPAKLFMGNSGSHCIGFLFAALSIYGDYATMFNPLAVLVPLLILAVPIIDTIYVIIMRIKKGIMPLRKSNDHIHMRLLRAKCGPKKTLVSIYLATILWGFSAVFISFGFNFYFLGMVLTAVLFTFRIIKIASTVE